MTLYVGSHDECDCWIKHNSLLEPNLDKKRNKITEVEEPVLAGDGPGDETGPDESGPDYDDLIFRDLTDQDLREIFCGLCRKQTG